MSPKGKLRQLFSSLRVLNSGGMRTPNTAALRLPYTILLVNRALWNYILEFPRCSRFSRLGPAEQGL